MNLNALLKHLALDKNEFLFQFQSHPAYPSALAFSDTLNFMGVRNDAYELEKQYWPEIDQPFITVYKDQFTLVAGKGGKYEIFSDKADSVDFKTLTNYSKELVLLFEKTADTPAVAQKSHLPFFLAAALLFVVALFFAGTASAWISGLLSLAGMYLSLEILKEKYGGTSALVSGLCGGEQQENASACSELIRSGLLDIGGLKIADLSAVYFILQGLLVLFLPATAGLMLILSAVSAAIILYSLYVQLIVEKKICLICLALIVVLAAQAACHFLWWGQLSFSLTPTLLTTLAATGLTGLFLLLTDFWAANKELKEGNTTLLRFKRNYDLFRTQLQAMGQVTFSDAHAGFFFGPKDAPLHISLISSPFCGYCEGAHHILEQLLEKYPEQISAQIRFNYRPEDSAMGKVLGAFKTSYGQEGPAAALQLMSAWYQSKDVEKIAAKNALDLQDLAAEAAQGKENRAFGFNFTPVFLLNGRQLPEMYDREDIFFFIDELMEDEQFIQ